jgi:hypothetical protein
MISMEKKIVKRVITFTHTVTILESDFDDDVENDLMGDDRAFELAFNEVNECKAQDAEIEMKCFDEDGNEVGDALGNPEASFA